jgi:hypothetical protein
LFGSRRTFDLLFGKKVRFGASFAKASSYARGFGVTRRLAMETPLQRTRSDGQAVQPAAETSVLPRHHESASAERGGYMQKEALHC